MGEITLKSDKSSDKTIAIFQEAIKTEELRVGYALDVGKKRLSVFEKKYGVSSEKFLNTLTAEDLDGHDLEYVEWAGELKLVTRLQERFDILKGIKYVNQ